MDPRGRKIGQEKGNEKGRHRERRETKRERQLSACEVGGEDPTIVVSAIQKWKMKTFERLHLRTVASVGGRQINRDLEYQFTQSVIIFTAHFALTSPNLFNSQSASRDEREGSKGQGGRTCQFHQIVHRNFLASFPATGT